MNNGIRVRTGAVYTRGRFIPFVRVTSPAGDDLHEGPPQASEAEARVHARALGVSIIARLSELGAKVKCMRCGRTHGVVPCEGAS